MVPQGMEVQVLSRALIERSEICAREGATVFRVEKQEHGLEAVWR